MVAEGTTISATLTVMKLNNLTPTKQQQQQRQKNNRKQHPISTTTKPHQQQTHPGSFHVSIIILRQSEICDLSNKVVIQENVTCSKVPVNNLKNTRIKHISHYQKYQTTTITATACIYVLCVLRIGHYCNNSAGITSRNSDRVLKRERQNARNVSARSRLESGQCWNDW